MSMTALRGYIRTNLKSIGYKEWADGFNNDNIPDSRIDKMFHLEPPQQSNVRTENLAVLFSARQPITVMFEGLNDTGKAIDAAVLGQENIIQKLMNGPLRLATANKFKNLTFKSARIEKVAKNNSTIAKLTIEFEANVFLDI